LETQVTESEHVVNFPQELLL